MPNHDIHLPRLVLEVRLTADKQKRRELYTEIDSLVNGAPHVYVR